MSLSFFLSLSLSLPPLPSPAFFLSKINNHTLRLGLIIYIRHESAPKILKLMDCHILPDGVYRLH